MENKYIIVNFGELYLKGKNIGFFEKRLLKNLLENLGKLSEFLEFEKKSGGSFWIKLSKDITGSQISEIKYIIGNTFGIVNYYIAYATDSKINSISDLTTYLSKIAVENDSSIGTFGIFVKRLDKVLGINSQEIGKIIGSDVWREIGKDVDLKNPDLKIEIKIKKDKTFVSIKKECGLGGLPVGTSGEAISLLSGGIDSPVASFLAMKRGLSITAVHFHSFPQTSEESIEKVKLLTKELKKFQLDIKLILVPIIDIQNVIADVCDSKLRLVLLRRVFLYITEKINSRYNINAKTIVTGDSLGQVASQTVENLIAVEDVISNRLLFRPLIALDKVEIIKLANEIGTYNISIIPHDDSCAMFTPKRPETKANIDYVRREEDKINLDSLLEGVFDKIKIIE